ncbi:MAG: hypothetical protein ABMA64_09335 [Myxococcota bacterium]
MRIHLDKIASSTRNVSLAPHVVVGPHIPAVPGSVVAVRVLDEKSTYNQIENVHGRMMTYRQGDVVAGVLGNRQALRGYSGVVPDEVRPGDVLHLLNLGGVIGRCTSSNPEVGPAARVEVLGSVLVFPELGRRVGSPANIFPGPVPIADALAPMPPCVFVVGTCMHAGKTAAACALVRGASARGLRVAATKVTGVALRRDTLEMQDNGAVATYTFADVGYPSTIGVDVVRAARGCLNTAATHDPDLVVVELGDGLMGEYGVREVMSTPDLAAAARVIVLAANDPVGAWGGDLLLHELGLKADLITGPATDNDAGCRGIAARTDASPVNARRQPDLFVEVVLNKLGITPRPVAAQGAK